MAGDDLEMGQTSPVRVRTPPPLSSSSSNHTTISGSESSQRSSSVLDEKEDQKDGGIVITTRSRLGTLESNFSGSTYVHNTSPTSSPSPTTPPVLSSRFERRLYAVFVAPILSLRRNNKVIAKVESYLRGPTPLISSTRLITPWFPRVESVFDRLFDPISSRAYLFLPLYLILWILAFVFTVRLSYFTSSTSAGAASFISADASYWAKDDGCGLDGLGCTPFANASQSFRCAGQTLSVQLLNYWDVGAQEVIFQPLVIGGFDDLKTYRADSWVCIAAIQHGLFGNRKGGCGVVNKIGNYTNYVGGTKNGVTSVGFPTFFPAAYRFDDISSQQGCQDLGSEILAMNVIASFVFSFVFRPKPAVFFWVLFCLGFWHIVLVGDSSSFPPNVSLGFQYFLPALFTGYAIWRFSWRFVVFAFEKAVLEKTVWYLAGFWVGVLMNVTFNWVPITQLTPTDIAKRPGGLIAVVVLSLLVFTITLNQLRIIRNTGQLLSLLRWYGVGLVVIGLLSAIPGLQLRLHHYIAALVLLPGTAFICRPSALFQGFLLGMFLNGVARWGFDSILETAAALVGDGATGSDLPAFLTNSTNFVIEQTTVFWNPIPSSLTSSWDSFSLIVDDVVAYIGPYNNYTITNLTSTLPHFFRLAYVNQGNSGDFTKAATAYISNGTWVDAASGAGG